MNCEHPIIFVVGLRRSGTTAFWEAFRLDENLCCYDEPFNPNLSQLPNENSKGTRKEFVDLCQGDGDLFRKMFCPIPCVEETSPSFSVAQADYLAWLVGQNQGWDAVVIDSVRLGFKLREIHAIIPQAVFIHLYRHPAAWVSSHLLPSGTGTWKKRVADLYRQFSFWQRKGFYNNWGYEEIINREIERGACWDSIGVKAAVLRDKPAYFRLALFWHWAFQEIETLGKELWDDRFFSVPFESFCSNPQKIISTIYGAAGLNWRELDYSYVGSANQGYKPESSRWQVVKGMT